MQIVKPSFEILTPISENGIAELKHIERIGRVCYKSEDRITEDGESAKKFVKMLIDHSHEAMLEHGSISVLFTVDRGVTHEMVRHRIASFAQESSRYCNYSLGKFGNEITVVLPTNYFWVAGVENMFAKGGRTPSITTQLDYETLESMVQDRIVSGNYTDRLKSQYYWAKGCLDAEAAYMNMINNGARAEIARAVLPTCTKANITITANYREWRTIFKLRCANDAHPDIQYIMRGLLNELNYRIPVLFDDLYYQFLIGDEQSSSY